MHVFQEKFLDAEIQDTSASISIDWQNSIEIEQLWDDGNGDESDKHI